MKTRPSPQLEGGKWAKQRSRVLLTEIDSNSTHGTSCAGWSRCSRYWPRLRPWARRPREELPLGAGVREADGCVGVEAATAPANGCSTAVNLDSRVTGLGRVPV